MTDEKRPAISLGIKHRYHCFEIIIRTTNPVFNQFFLVQISPFHKLKISNNLINQFLIFRGNGTLPIISIQYVIKASLIKEEKLCYEKNWDRISSEKTLLTEAKSEGITEGLALGIERGKIKGIEEGKKHEKLEIAIKLRQLGMTDAEIQNITGVRLKKLD